MESSLCVQNLKNKRLGKIVVGRDRLSSLPDEVLTHIISFLPATKDGIKTSILSTRWKYLWTCVPNYKFVYLPDGADARAAATYNCFINSVDRLFHLRNRRFCIEKFYVKTSYAIRRSIQNNNINQNDNPPDVDAWISYLISCRNIKKISLKLEHIRSLYLCLLPSRLFTCTTLVSLKLHGCFKLNLSTSSIFLPNLKVLQLIEVYYLNDETVSRLLSGCPVLEDLTMQQDFLCSDVKYWNIAVPSLKYLRVYYSVAVDLDIMIDARNLEELYLTDYFSKFIYVHKSSSLLRACVDVLELEPHLVEALLLAISDVKILRLGGNIMGHISDINLHLPTFRNVQDLKLRVMLFVSTDVLTKLLRSMPKLQKLVLEALSGYETNFEWSPPEDVPVCLSSHLKTIEIEDFFGNEDEVKLIKYFLKSGKVLEKMNISPQTESPSLWVVHDEDRWLKSQEELLNSALGSNACQLSFIMKKPS